MVFIYGDDQPKNVITDWYFDHLMCHATYDTEYPSCGWHAKDLEVDIIKVLHPYFETLTDAQLEQLANVIRDRRDHNEDLVRSVRYFLEYQYSVYMEHIYPIIKVSPVHEHAHDAVMRNFLEKRFSAFRLASMRVRHLPAEVCNYMARTFLGIEDAV